MLIALFYTGIAFGLVWLFFWVLSKTIAFIENITHKGA